MLNLAGLLAPVVAMVPTPLACPTDKEKCIPPEYVPGLENNFKALLVLGALGIAFTILSLRLDSHADTRMWWGVLAAVIMWTAQALWFWLGRASFLVGAHYASAVPLFALLASVAFVNAKHVPGRQPPPQFAANVPECLCRFLDPRLGVRRDTCIAAKRSRHSGLRNARQARHVMAGHRHAVGLPVAPPMARIVDPQRP